MNAITRMAMAENKAVFDHWSEDRPVRATFADGVRLPGYMALMNKIMGEVAEKYGVTVDELKGKSKVAWFVDARSAVACEARSHGISLEKIGFCMGRRTHNTIKNLIERAAR